MDSRHFGGLDEKASLININTASALDMDNWEVDTPGCVQLRNGYTEAYDFGAAVQYFGSYYTTTGDLVFVAVVGTAFYEATDPAGPWTNRTGSVTLTVNDGPWIGADLQGRFYLANGVDDAITHTYGSDAQTVKAASYLDPPTTLRGEFTGTAGATQFIHWVTAITANGETPLSAKCDTFSCNATLDASNYITLTWDIVPGAQGYKIYYAPYTVAATEPVVIGVVGALTDTFVSSGQAAIPGGAPATTTAFNTQSTWDGNPVQGFTVLARGRAQRMIAWRDNAVWASALSNGLDWLTSNDAFQFEVAGGRDNRIRAGAGLYDYLILFSRTNSFVYTGSTYNDIAQSKVLGVGCDAPNSIVTSGDDLYFWSEFGPNRFSRVQAGQDIQSNQDFSGKVDVTVQRLSNRSEWFRIVAFQDVHRNRIGWCYPNGSDTANSKAILFNYEINAWSRHTLGAIVSAVIDDNRNVYAALSGGKIIQLYSTSTTDDGAVITGTYETGWYDSQAFLNRVNNWLDLVVDTTQGNYSFTVTIYHEFSSTPSSTHTLTQTATDSVPVYSASSTANIHRVYTAGFGKYFKLVFTVTSSTTPPRVWGWRPEMHSRGTR